MTQATIEFASDVIRDETLALDAAERFYVGLNRMFAGDVEPLVGVWSPRPYVTLLGPFGGRQIGIDRVTDFFKRDAAVKKGGLVTPRDLVLRVWGDLAWSVAIESGSITTKSGTKVPLDLRGTNILERDGDTWRIVHHHTDPLPAMQSASGLKTDDFETSKLRPDDSVLKAIERRYDAINKMFKGDVDTLSKLWVRSDEVTLGCPEGNWKIGYSKICGEFSGFSSMSIGGTVRFKDPYVRVIGDTAYASFLEYSDNLTFSGKPMPFKGRVTVVLVRERGEWLQLHHHADTSPEVRDFVSRLKK